MQGQEQRMMEPADEIRLLVEKYRQRATHMPAEELWRQALVNGVPRLHVAVLLRDLYGFSLEQCKRQIGQCERGDGGTI
jgi:hypothetical protein